jgi:hypothetical protein
VKRYFAVLQRELEGAKGDAQLEALAAPLADAFGRLQKATMTIATRGMQNPEEAAAAATDYLRMFGLVAVGYMWLRMARAAQARLAAGASDAGYYETKLATARFYMTKLLPQTRSLASTIEAGAEPVMALAVEAF